MSRKPRKRRYDEHGRRIRTVRATKPAVFYRVLAKLRAIPSHHEYGYENPYDFLRAIRNIEERYGGLVGECVETRHAFYRLRIYDPLVWPKECVWIPKFMCEGAEAPPAQEKDDDPLDGVFGDGW